MKLTSAQKREYEFLKKYGSKYVGSWSLRRVYQNLVKLDLAKGDGSWHWFHLKKQKQMKNIHIALDSYFFFERDNFQRIKDFLDENKIESDIYKILPFSHEIQPLLPKDKIVIPFGCIEFVQEIRNLSEIDSKIFFDENIFTNENCLNKWGDLCLNSDAQIMSVEDAIKTLEDKQYFMRPVEDLKSFTGNLFTPGHLPSLLERYGSYENNQFNSKSRIVVSEPKKIKREWRTFIVDGKVASASMYRENGKHKEELGAPDEVYSLCEKALEIYMPAKAFAFDVCELESGVYKIIEFGCIHNCGFYKGDVEIVFSKLMKLFEAICV